MFAGHQHIADAIKEYDVQSVDTPIGVPKSNARRFQIEQQSQRLPQELARQTHPFPGLEIVGPRE